MLIIGSTHIGNPNDIPPRSLEYVRTADLLLFEEDRPARQVLKAAGVHREYFKYNEHQGLMGEAKDALNSGLNVLYMSDQGTANLADPGLELLKFAHQYGIEILVIPGPSSVTAALSACPFSTQPFLYAGFLDKKSEKRTKELEKLAQSESAIVILDTPYRLQNLTQDLKIVFGKNRNALLALDISGPNEKYIFENCANLAVYCQGLNEKLNFVLVIAPKSSRLR